MNMIRSFVAVNIPEIVRNELAGIERQLKSRCGDVKWVRPESLHMTLKFLGNVDPGGLDAISRVLERSAVSLAAFSLVLGGLGRFPHSGAPRVIWVGVREGAEQLKGLAASVETALMTRGFEREKRPFSPHLTLGRVRMPKSASGMDEAIREIDYMSEPFTVAEFSLMRSDLLPSGARYSVIHSVQLKG